MEPDMSIDHRYGMFLNVIDDSPESDGKYRFIYGDAVIDFELICQ